MKCRFLIPLFLLFAAYCSQGQTLPTFITDSLDNYCKTGIKGWQIPGMAVAVVKDGKVVFMKGYGVREFGKPDLVDENTLFMIGSNTKAFTATALTMLEQEKKLSLDDKVTKWIPYFRLDNALASQEVTVRDLLCHRIGFETFQGDFTYWGSTLSRREVIEKMALVKAPYGFRTRWGYCNAAFATAGEVVHSVTGQNWEDVIRQRILKPLNMSRTLMLAAELPTASNAAAPHTLVDGKLVKVSPAGIDNLAPAGTMSSSVSDMTHWLITQLNKGTYEGNQVIPAAAIMATRIPHSFQGVDQTDKAYTHFTLYGLGFDLRDRAGRIVVSHTGGVDGFLSAVTMVPEEKLGIVVLTNTDENSLFAAVAAEIRDAFLNLPHGTMSNRAMARVFEFREHDKRRLDSLRAVVARKNKSSVALGSYTGTYSNSLYGDIDITQSGDRLEIHFSHHPALTGKLELLEGTTFLCTYSIPIYGVKETPFRIENGKVTGFTLHVNDFVEFTPYEFVKK